MKTLETHRLILRAWEMDDLDDFYEYAKNPNVGPMAGWEPHGSKEVSKKILESFIEKDEVWAIEYKANRKVIGSIGAHPDMKRQGIRARMIGYALSEDYWGQGIMTEAVKEVIRYLFEEEKYDMVSCYHYPFNKRSKRVIEKCGFIYEGTLRSVSMIYDGTTYDVACYSITKEDYYQRLK
ncbi:MAG: GNAT family N-acetyltransferase [Clostridia bacterium]|jgi:ribosomal-protein-alanine N-acetyltransferase